MSDQQVCFRHCLQGKSAAEVCVPESSDLLVGKIFRRFRDGDFGVGDCPRSGELGAGYLEALLSANSSRTRVELAGQLGVDHQQSQGDCMKWEQLKLLLVLNIHM